MLPNVYISTSAFKNRSLKKILETCLEHRFTNVELSANVDYADDNGDAVRELHKSGQMRFLVHNYFPRPKEDFVLNLASDDEKVVRQSIQHCQIALDLSAELGASFFSVHAGFAFHAQPQDLGRPQLDLPRIPYAMAYRNFVKNVKVLLDYAAKKNVYLTVENNVVAKFNLINGKNGIALLADADEALRFYKEVGRANLFFLIDLGHLKVSSAAMGFDREDYLQKVLPFTTALHLSDNDGLGDTTRPFGEDVWFKDVIKRSKNKTWILEISNVDAREIKDCYKALENLLS